MWPRRTLKPDGSSFNQPPASRDTANSQCRATSQRPSTIPHFLFVQTMNRLHPVAATGFAPPARWAVGALPPSRKTQEREAAKTDKQKTAGKSGTICLERCCAHPGCMRPKTTHKPRPRVQRRSPEAQAPFPAVVSIGTGGTPQHGYPLPV